MNTSSSAAAASQPLLSVNEVRLGRRAWLAVLAIVVGCAVAVPALWKRAERFRIGPDYRIPYALSTDYWLYQRRLEEITDPQAVAVLGDSVVWGQYVRRGGTLTHFLNREAGWPKGTVPFSSDKGTVPVSSDETRDSPRENWDSSHGRLPERFLNCGVNGLFPLAMEGLVDYYARSLRDRKVLLHCNVLWMSSPQADLSVKKEKEFNHPRLVPQFFPRIPCYRADSNERLSAVIERNLGLFAWVNHLDDMYFDQRSIPGWTLEEDGSEPPRRPNAWRNPLAADHNGRARGSGRRPGAWPGQSPAPPVARRIRPGPLRLGGPGLVAAMAGLPAGRRPAAQPRLRRAGPAGPLQRAHGG